MGSKIPTPVPKDILDRVEEDFSVDTEIESVSQYVNELHLDSSRINVGPSQFCRAILVLAEGCLNRFNELIVSPHDPRDIIMEAESKLGHPRHYFIPPFGEQ